VLPQRLVLRLCSVHRRSFLRAATCGLGAAVAACTRPVSIPEPSLPGPELPAPLTPGFLFATGVENSYPLLPDGTRHDQLLQCGHYERWHEDFGLAQSLGVDALRYGPAWYRTNPAPGHYDWSSADDQMAWLRESGITVIADLCHFGAPDWLDGFQDPALPLHLAAYAREFAKRYPWVRHFTPVNEILVAANFSAMLGWWNERATGTASFARALRNLSMGHELAVESILAERRDAIIVQVESFEYFTPADASSEAAEQARFWNDARFAALDLTLGRMPSPVITDLLMRGGMTTTDFAFLRERRALGQRWLGVDYYVTSEQLVDGDGKKRTAPSRIGLAALAAGYYDRYGLPLFISETSRVASRGVAWLDEQWNACRELLASGVPLRGFTWFPLGDVVDWRHALRVKRGDVDPIGLYDLSREPHPAADAYRQLIASARSMAALPAQGRRAG
jgi:beta-glucosidase/6-phospho-beta-glucosidase/beta-galactosidase